MTLGASEPLVHLTQTTGRVEVRVRDLGALFDPEATPGYPHEGPMVNPSIAEFLIDAVREQRHQPKVEVVVLVEKPPSDPEMESRVRAQLGRFFANEAELVGLQIRVNRTEGLESLRYALPLVVLAGLVAVIASSGVLEGELPPGLLSFIYVVFVVVVWVLIWDPIEMILFDSHLFRLRMRALRKLESATYTVVRHPPT